MSSLPTSIRRQLLFKSLSNKQHKLTEIRIADRVIESEAAIRGIDLLLVSGIIHPDADGCPITGEIDQIDWSGNEIDGWSENNNAIPDAHCSPATIRTIWIS